MVRVVIILSLAALSGAVWPSPALAQPLGTFRWRTEPYCNVLTVTVTPVGGVYTLEGFDEQCGGSPRQPVRGVALPQANGSVTLGVSVIALPGGTPVNIEAGISPTGLNGTWRDSAGNSGTLTFAPTATSGGPRPLPTPPTSLPSAFIAQPRGSFVARGDANDPDINPVQGAGRRMVWHAGRAAFRAGEVLAGEWDDASVGFFSTAFGSRTIAQGTASFAAGFNSAALGSASVALGSNARSGSGSFTFADQVSAFFTSGANQFNARATGGVGFYTNGTLTAGVELRPGASAWSSVSDVNRKENFRDLDGDDVLAKLARMPIREWNYKAQDAAIRHVGPTAQDFHAAFGLGEDPLRISTIDADGIALAGVSALARENAVLKADLAALRAELASLRSALTGVAPQ